MSILDLSDILNDNIQEKLAYVYIKYVRDMYCKYGDSFLWTGTYKGIIGEWEDDKMVLINIVRTEYERSVRFIYDFYWISINHPKYSKQQYYSGNDKYHCVYHAGSPVTPELIIKYLMK